jgi:hypothetical protein
VSAEKQRIEFLVARDGDEEARAWIARTAHIYREALRNSDYASAGAYRHELERAVREFDEWLAAHGGEARAKALEPATQRRQPASPENRPA